MCVCWHQNSGCNTVKLNNMETIQICRLHSVPQVTAQNEMFELKLNDSETRRRSSRARGQRASYGATDKCICTWHKVRDTSLITSEISLLLNWSWRRISFNTLWCQFLNVEYLFLSIQTINTYVNLSWCQLHNGTTSMKDTPYSHTDVLLVSLQALREPAAFAKSTGCESEVPHEKLTIAQARRGTPGQASLAWFGNICRRIVNLWCVSTVDQQ